MKKSLLKHIICPYCKQGFKLEEFGSYTEKNNNKEWKEIISGYLKCSCRWYPVIKGVPRILPDAILWQVVQTHYSDFLIKFKNRLPNILDKHKTDLHSKKKTRTLKGFGFEWKRFPKLYNAYTKQFIDWIKPVKQDFFRKKFVLDAGCGTGRHTYHSTLWGAETIGIDLSEAVDVAYKNTGKQIKTHIIQADIFNLPFKPSTFDYIYSIGVIHHLPSPIEGFKFLTNYLKPKKHISIWIYGKEGNCLLRIVDPIRKYILSKLPLKLNLFISCLITLLLYPLIRIIYAPLNQNSLTRPIAALLPQNAFFNYLSNFNFKIVHSIVFDQMLAPVAYYCSKRQVAAWFNHANVKILSISLRNQNSWRAFGIKE